MELHEPALSVLENCSRVSMSFDVSFLQESPLEKAVSEPAHRQASKKQYLDFKQKFHSCV